MEWAKSTRAKSRRQRHLLCLWRFRSSKICSITQFSKDGDLLASTYEYKYNGKGKCIWKRLPGAQYIQYWYDKMIGLCTNKMVNYAKRHLSFLCLWQFRKTCHTRNNLQYGWKMHRCYCYFRKITQFYANWVHIENDFVTSGDIELVNYYDTYDFYNCHC